MVRLVQLAYRYSLDPNPRAREVTLKCVRALIDRGESPICHHPTPMRVVADFCGVRSERSLAFFRVLRAFFADNRLLNDTTIMCALINGQDVRGLKNWAYIMELEELTAEYDIFAAAADEFEK